MRLFKKPTTQLIVPPPPPNSEDVALPSQTHAVSDRDRQQQADSYQNNNGIESIVEPAQTPAALDSTTITPPEITAPSLTRRQRLMEVISAGFDDEELKDLAHDMQINYKTFNTSMKRVMIQQLVSHAIENNQLNRLIELCKSRRPRVTWQIDAVGMVPAEPGHGQPEWLEKFVNQIDSHFSVDEIHDLAQDLGLDYEEFPGKGSKLALALVLHCKRRGMLPLLIARCQALRPDTPLQHAANWSSQTGNPKDVYEQANPAKIRDLIIADFSVDEMKQIALGIGLEANVLDQWSGAVIARELVLHAERCGRLLELLAYCRQQRPTESWPRAEDVSATIDLGMGKLQGESARLRDLIVKHFSLYEVFDWMHYLGVNPDDFPVMSETKKTAFVRELVLYFERVGQLDELRQYCQRKLPDLAGKL